MSMPTVMEAKPLAETVLMRKHVHAKDPSDAAQVPPSVMRDHIGAPAVLHNDPHAKHAERHGSRSGSHQEQNI